MSTDSAVKTKTPPKQKSFHAPLNTTQYIVDENETIEKIALKWNTIPSEISRINCLFSRILIPGQVLYVPDKNYVLSSPIVKNNIKTEEIKPVEQASQNIVETNSNILRESDFIKSDEEYMQRWFLKLDSQLIAQSFSIIDGFFINNTFSINV